MLQPVRRQGGGGVCGGSVGKLVRTKFESKPAGGGKQARRGIPPPKRLVRVPGVNVHRKVPHACLREARQAMMKQEVRGGKGGRHRGKGYRQARGMNGTGVYGGAIPPRPIRPIWGGGSRVGRSVSKTTTTNTIVIRKGSRRK